MSRKKLADKRIVLTGTRKLEEMSKLVEKQGGIPLIRSLSTTIFYDDIDIKTQLFRTIHENIDWFIFTTGVGINQLYQTAQQMGLKNEWIQKLKEAKVAGRGYKVAHALKKLGVELTVRDEDGTTNGLIRPLESYPLQGQKIALQLYGESSLSLVEFLQQKEANLFEILPYQQIPPNEEILETLLQEILNQEIDAVTFTSGTPVQFLFKYAREKGLSSELQKAISSHVVIAAVGKYTADCLRKEGVEQIVTPEEEKMGSMIVALANHLSSR
ncbi:uroporphyrinogen-III synthase [Thermoflavimicrobium daqui]|uniref:Uroporphyrinogen-III synthase n=1 Tax=Thermoflavimicrobium daqui TaxID=2137476 RepID=A0A364K4E6_9BACL|nr:uroporphyrinogen-III synthase [Thermoflavimicrobium daqui]RAL24258.1 uroporphyrinogen-III synthase [Thermoflavimicrobium daqui]